MEQNNSNKSWMWIIGAVVVIGIIFFVVNKGSKTNTPSATQTTTPTTQAVQVPVQFASHIQAKLPEQDVFIQGSKTNEVVRVEGDAATKPETLAKTAYAAASAVAHDPFKLGKNPLGPFAKGQSLGFTLGQWLAATGSGTYTVNGSEANLALNFQELVPNGTYTLWCSRLTFPPNPEIVDRPCGAADGSQNTLRADNKGNTTFNLKLSPLEQSSKETASVIALAYHSDGQTYGADPGEFGFKTHVQIFFLVPPPK